MIREPYGLYPYNNIIEIKENPVFSCIFSGDQLQAYRSNIRTQTGELLSGNTIKKVQNIYNNQELTVATNITATALTSHQSESLFWNVELWEDNAIYGIGSYIVVNASNSSGIMTSIDINAIISIPTGTDLNGTRYILNAIVNNKKYRIKEAVVDTQNTKTTLKFTTGLEPVAYEILEGDLCVLKANFNLNQGAIDKQNLATIQTLNSKLVSGTPANKQIFNTGTCLLLQEMMNKLSGAPSAAATLVSSMFALLEIDQSNYTITYYEQPTDFISTFQIGNEIKEISYLVYCEDEHLDTEESPTAGDIKGFLIINSACSQAYNQNTPFKIYRNKYVSNYAQFTPKTISTVSIINKPQAAIATNFYNFVATYSDFNNIPIRSYTWTLLMGIEVIDSQTVEYNNYIAYSYDNFLSNKSYSLQLEVINTDGLTCFDSVDFSVTDIIESQTGFGEMQYNDNHSITLSWTNGIESIPDAINFACMDKNYVSIKPDGYLKYNKRNGKDLSLGASNALAIASCCPSYGQKINEPFLSFGIGNGILGCYYIWQFNESGQFVSHIEVKYNDTKIIETDAKTATQAFGIGQTHENDKFYVWKNTYDETTQLHKWSNESINKWLIGGSYGEFTLVLFGTNVYCYYINSQGTGTIKNASLILSNENFNSINFYNVKDESVKTVDGFLNVYGVYCGNKSDYSESQFSQYNSITSLFRNGNSSICKWQSKTHFFKNLGWDSIPNPFNITNLTAVYNTGTTGEHITGYKIYRSEDGNTIGRYLVGSISESQLDEAMSGDNIIFTDYSIANRKNYSYQVLPVVRNGTGITLTFRDGDSDKLSTDWYEWKVAILTKQSQGFYSINKYHLFSLNIEDSELTYNQAFSSTDSLGEFPVVSKGSTTYFTTSLTALLGRPTRKGEYVDDDTVEIDEFLEYAYTSSPILLQDVKGHSFIGTISNLRFKNDNKIDDMPTTVSFDFAQTANISDFKIYSIGNSTIV